MLAHETAYFLDIHLHVPSLRLTVLHTYYELHGTTCCPRKVQMLKVWHCKTSVFSLRARHVFTKNWERTTAIPTHFTRFICYKIFCYVCKQSLFGYICTFTDSFLWFSFLRTLTHDFSYFLVSHVCAPWAVLPHNLHVWENVHPLPRLHPTGELKP